MSYKYDVYNNPQKLKKLLGIIVIDVINRKLVLHHASHSPCRHCRCWVFFFDISDNAFGC